MTVLLYGRLICFVSEMSALKGEGPFSPDPIGTSWLKIWKFVITSGGSNESDGTCPGDTTLNPLIPPKYISPDRLWQNACSLNSLACKPSATVKFVAF